MVRCALPDMGGLKTVEDLAGHGRGAIVKCDDFGRTVRLYRAAWSPGQETVLTPLDEQVVTAKFVAQDLAVATLSRATGVRPRALAAVADADQQPGTRKLSVRDLTGTLLLETTLPAAYDVLQPVGADTVAVSQSAATGKGRSLLFSVLSSRARGQVMKWQSL